MNLLPCPPSIETMNHERSGNGVSTHILPTSATMVGVCVTVISIVRLIEANAAVATMVDNIVAVDSMFFLAAALISYLSIRSAHSKRALEGYADVVFMIGLVIMAATSFILAWELGQVPS